MPQGPRLGEYQTRREPHGQQRPVRDRPAKASAVTGPYEVLVLIGPPGAGKSTLGNALAARGVVSYVEIEPMLVAKFGTDLEARMEEVGAFIWKSYQQQLREAVRTVMFESAGIADGQLHAHLLERFRTTLVLVTTPRELCIDRVVERGPARNVSHTTDRERVGAHYDWWHREIAPRTDYAAEVACADLEAAVVAVVELLGET